jgi:gamma-glutamylcysteine synthetase
MSIVLYLLQTKAIASELGVAFLGLGFDPKTRMEDVPIMPKERYRHVPVLLEQCFSGPIYRCPLDWT